MPAWPLGPILHLKNGRLTEVRAAMRSGSVSRHSASCSGEIPADVDDALEQRRAVEKVFKRDSQPVWMGARGNQIRRCDC